MKPRHIALALLVALIWGVNFVVIRVGLDSFPPIFMAALRFTIAALPVLLLPRPRVPWGVMIPIGATIFVGQFALLFTAMSVGMPPGLASIVLQVQAFLTILIAAIALREIPGARQIGGAVVAFAGLAAIAATANGDVTPLGLALSLAAALSWAIGNVLLRRVGQVDMLAMISWLSLVAPLPLLALSLAIEGPQAIGVALAGVSLIGIGAILYIAFLATTVGFGLWGHLLKLYPAGTVAPFSLLVPIFGTLSAALLLGERFGPLRLLGMALILVGLAFVVLPGRLLKPFGRRQ